MAKNNRIGSQENLPPKRQGADKGDGGSPPKLQGLDSNAQGDFGPQFWQAFRDSFTHIYTLSLPDPSEEARFTLSTRTYHTPSAILMRSQGTAFVMARGPAMVARSADQLLIYLELEGSCGQRLERTPLTRRGGRRPNRRLCAAVPQCDNRLCESDRHPCARERARRPAGT